MEKHSMNTHFSSTRMYVLKGIANLGRNIHIHINFVLCTHQCQAPWNTFRPSLVPLCPNEPSSRILGDSQSGIKLRKACCQMASFICTRFLLVSRGCKCATPG
jgi:hypothetical protein